MIRRLLSLIVIVSAISTTVGCNNASNVNVENKPLVSEEQKIEYNSIIDKEIDELGDVTDDIKVEKKEKLLYDLIVDREGRSIMEDILNTITREEAITEYEKNLRPKIVKVVEMESKCDDENHEHELTDDGYDRLKYYIYEGDDTLDNETIENAFPNARNVTVREATYDENIDDIRKSLASSEFVKVVESKVEKVLE